MEKVLPKGWVKTEFANLIAHVIGGDWGKDSDVEDENFVEVYCIRGSEIKNWNTNFGDTSVVRKIKKSSLDSRRLINGDILLEISGGGPDQPVGRVVLITQNTFDRLPELPIVCTNFLRLIRPVSQINSNYFCSYLEYFYYSGEVVKYQGGSNNLRNLKYKEYETIQIPLPPLAEQERIVDKVDKLFAKHEKIKKALDRIPQLLKAFRQQVLTQAVTGKLTEQWREGKDLEEWQSLLLKDIIEGTPKNGAYYPQSNYGSGVKIIRIDNFYDGDLKDWEKVKLVQASFEDIDTYGIEYNNILINRVNSIQYLGKCLLFKLKDVQCIYESNMMKIVLKPEVIYPDYAKIFLNSNIGLTELRQNAKHAVNQASINQSDVMNVNIPIPPIKEQQEIVRQVESLFAKADAIESRYQPLKAKIDNLPQAILHKAFKGELVPQLPTDGDAKDLLAEIMALKEEVKGKRGKA